MLGKKHRSNPVPVPARATHQAEHKAEDDNAGSLFSGSEMPPASPGYADSFRRSIAAHEQVPGSPQDIISGLIDNDGELWGMVNDERHNAYVTLQDVLEDTIKTVNNAVLPLAEHRLCEEWRKLIALEMRDASISNFTQVNWSKKINVAMREVEVKLRSSLQGVFNLVWPVLPFQVHYYMPSIQAADQSMSDTVEVMEEKVGGVQPALHVDEIEVSIAKSVEGPSVKTSIHFTGEDERLDATLIADLKNLVLRLHQVEALLRETKLFLSKISESKLEYYNQYGGHASDEDLIEKMREIGERNNIVQDLYISTIGELVEPHINYIKIIESGVKVFLEDEKIAGDASLPRKIYHLPLDEAGNRILQYVHDRHGGNAAGDNANANRVKLSSAERALISKAPMSVLLEPIGAFDNFLLFAVSVQDSEIGRVTMERFATEVAVMEELKPTDNSIPDKADWAEQKALLLKGLDLLKEAKDHIGGYYENRLHKRKQGNASWDERIPLIKKLYAKRIPQRGKEAAKMMLALIAALEHLDVGDVAQEVEEITGGAGFTFGVSGSELHSSMRAWCKKAREMCTKKYNDALREYNKKRVQYERAQENAGRDKAIKELQQARKQDTIKHKREKQELNGKIDAQAIKLDAQATKLSEQDIKIAKQDEKIDRFMSMLMQQHLTNGQPQLSSAESPNATRPAPAAAEVINLAESLSQDGRLSPATVNAALFGVHRGSV